MPMSAHAPSINSLGVTRGFLRIPLKLDTDSTANWTLIPRETGQSERSDAGLKGFYSEVGILVKFFAWWGLDFDFQSKIKIELVFGGPVDMWIDRRRRTIHISTGPTLVAFCLFRLWVTR